MTLACVVDDAASGVTLVVRGADLRPSTPTQRLLQILLSLPEPAYLHHPLVTHEDGRRLAKRDQAPTLAAMRAAGVDGRTDGLAHHNISFAANYRAEFAALFAGAESQIHHGIGDSNHVFVVFNHDE